MIDLPHKSYVAQHETRNDSLVTQSNRISQDFRSMSALPASRQKAATVLLPRPLPTLPSYRIVYKESTIKALKNLKRRRTKSCSRQPRIGRSNEPLLATPPPPHNQEWRMPLQRLNAVIAPTYQSWQPSSMRHE